MDLAKSGQMSEENERGRDRGAFSDREVPIQVMVPEWVRREVAVLGAERGENIRTTVLRGLKAIGIDIPESQMRDRRGRNFEDRRRSDQEAGNGKK